MKNFITILTLCLIAQLFRPCLAQENVKGQFVVQPYVGFHRTDLRWSIAGNKQGKDPNVLSELIWKDLKGPQAGLKLQYGITKRFVAKVDFSMADITSGDATDADYASDDRQDVFYNEKFQSDAGFDLSLRTSLAYVLFSTQKLQLSPYLGFDLRKQQVFLYDLPGAISYSYLNSRYQTNWQGGIVGLSTNLKAGKFNFGLDLSGSLLKYRAVARWNLIEQFAQPVSFRHSTNAFALQGAFDAGYALNKNFSVMLNFGSVYAKGLAGTDEAYYVSGSPEQTQLNEVKSFSFRLGAGFSYRF